MYVIKASGDKEQFDSEKIFRTCLRAGASRNLAKRVVDEVSKNIYEGITTKEILKLTLSLLKEQPDVAARYDLKRAIMTLGPTGFPFEKFFAEILQNYGYKTKVGTIVSSGKESHEIDIIAIKEIRYMVECKYHNRLGIQTPLKVAIYAHTRLLHLKEHFDRAWIACNTKCSADAINYAKSVNIKITSWGYPKNDSLEKLIERKGLYPITILRGVNRYVKDKFAQNNIMLAKDLLKYRVEDLKRMTRLDENKIKTLITDVNNICRCNNGE